MCVLVFIFVWDSRSREKRMAARLDSVTDENRKCQRETIQKATTVMESVKEEISYSTIGRQEVRDVLREVRDELRRR